MVLSVALVLTVPSEGLLSATTYFALLAARPDAIVAKEYKSQAQINADSEVNPNIWVTYDPTIGAAKVTIINDDQGDGSLQNIVRTALGRVYTDGTLFAVWEAQWHAHWADPVYRAMYEAPGGSLTHPGLHHKTFQLANDVKPGGGPLRWEIRNRFTINVSKPNISSIDVRLYDSCPGGTRSCSDEDPLSPQLAQFQIKPFTWIRFYEFVEFRRINEAYFSLWVQELPADPARPPVQLHNRVLGKMWKGGGISHFWFEYNCSCKRASTAQPLYAWFRNLVVLRNVSEPLPIIALGAAGSTITVPAMPTSVGVLP
jgi:hypothetical protein